MGSAKSTRSSYLATGQVRRCPNLRLLMRRSAGTSLPVLVSVPSLVMWHHLLSHSCVIARSALRDEAISPSVDREIASPPRRPCPMFAGLAARNDAANLFIEQILHHFDRFDQRRTINGEREADVAFTRWAKRDPRRCADARLIDQVVGHRP